MVSESGDAGPRSRFLRTQWLALGPTIVGGIALWQGTELGVGSLRAPGPGLWPVIIGGFLIATAVPIFLWDHDQAVESLNARSRRIFVGLLLLCLFVWLFSNLGLLIASFTILLIWLPMLGKEKFWMSALVAVSVATALYLIFGLALGVAFPPDIWAR